MFYFVFCISVYLSKTCFFLQAFVSCDFLFFCLKFCINQTRLKLTSCNLDHRLSPAEYSKLHLAWFREIQAEPPLCLSGKLMLVRTYLSLSLYHHLLLATCQNLSKPMGPRKHGGYALGLDDHDRYDRPSRLIWSSPSRQPGTICTVGFTTLLG